MEARIGMLAVIAGMLLGQSPVWGAPLPKPVYSSKTRFRIPFKFDAAALKRANTREVQLYVSTNQGDAWELAQTLPPDGSKFEYSCTSEGEFWFSVKTLDGQGQLTPPRGSYETGLIVIVDTTTPHLDLTLQQIAAGTLQVRWRASDTNLDIESLKLEYLAPGSKDWTLLDVSPRARGETSWKVRQSGIVSVRGSITDAAGNVANPKVQIDVDADNYPALKQRAIPQGKIANKPDDDDSVGRARVDATISENSVPVPDDEGPGYHEVKTRPQLRLRNIAPPTDQYAMKPSRSRLDGSASIPATTISRESETSNPDAAEFEPEAHSDVSNRPMGKAGADQRGNTNRTARKKFVRSQHFQIGYKLDDVGPSGVGAVELFITEDNGRKWWKYGDDPDQKTPFDVEVPREGEYGFAIRVRSGAGLSLDPPAPGDLPEIVIVVDQTVPKVELLPVRQGAGANSNRLTIRWRVKEDHPSDKSVSLYYAASSKGPWETISDWKNITTGEYDWTAGREVPVQFYVRVMVRDAAGNIGTAETAQPLTVDLARPTAQIIDIEQPVESNPR